MIVCGDSLNCSLPGIAVPIVLNSLLLLGKLDEPLFEEHGPLRDHVFRLVLDQIRVGQVAGQIKSSRFDSARKGRLASR